MKILGFLKIYNEVLKGNLERCVRGFDRLVDRLYVCDDGSLDDPATVIAAITDKATILRFEDNRFEKELERKQALLDRIHRDGGGDWILWLDADEILDRRGLAEFRAYVAALRAPAARFHEINLWLGEPYYRTDSGFDDGYFIRLWRYSPGLRFEIRPGTHHHQFPTVFKDVRLPIAPYKVLHYGNASLTALKFKAIQYYGGLGDVDRHLHFERASFSPTSPSWFEHDITPGPPPGPLAPETIAAIEELRNLTALPGWFAIILPTHNRAHTLARAVESVFAQTYKKWLLFILDDGSTDDTPTLVRQWTERDPRVFYARYPVHRGGVAMNNIGMEIAVHVAEYWTRLGSDDWWLPTKLENDARVLSSAHVVYAPFFDHDNGRFLKNPNTPNVANDLLAQGRFAASWANIAMRTSVLRAVKAQFGTYVDPSLRNMEDFLFNWRAARLFTFAWRPECDAVWNRASDGASADIETYRQDQALTEALIARESSRPIVIVTPSRQGDHPMHGNVREYWKIAASFPFFKERVYPEHERIQEFDTITKAVVLEYGCGSGSDARCYLERGNQVILADIVPENLEAARRNIEQYKPELLNRARFLLLEDSATIPLDDESVDAINAHGVLHHIEDPTDVLKEFNRVLRRSGLIYVMLFDERVVEQLPSDLRNGKTIAELSTLNIGPVWDGSPYSRFYLIEQGRQLLEAAGFRVVDVAEYTVVPFRRFKAVKTASLHVKAEPLETGRRRRLIRRSALNAEPAQQQQQ